MKWRVWGVFDDQWDSDLGSHTAPNDPPAARSRPSGAQDKAEEPKASTPKKSIKINRNQSNTVDGRNPAPVEVGSLSDIPLFTWFYISQAVQDFLHQQKSHQLKACKTERTMSESLCNSVQPLVWNQWIGHQETRGIQKIAADHNGSLCPSCKQSISSLSSQHWHWSVHLPRERPNTQPAPRRSTICTP